MEHKESPQYAILMWHCIRVVPVAAKALHLGVGRILNLI